MDAAKMQLKQKINLILKKEDRDTTLKGVAILLSAVFLLSCFVVFIQVKSVNFYYGGDSCVAQLTMLPEYSKQVDNNSGFGVIHKNIVKFADLELFSLKTCFVAKEKPTSGSVVLSVAPFGGWFAKKTFQLQIPTPPKVRSGLPSVPIATMRPLVIELSETDAIFDYQIEMNDKATKCSSENSKLHCNIATLNLLNDKDYDLELVRMFDGDEVETLLDSNVRTISATKLVKSSVSQGQTIYEKPRLFSFEFDKSINDADIKLERVDGDKRATVALTREIKGKSISALIKTDLDRDSVYEITAYNLVASDGSGLDSPIKISFRTSGGPAVTSVNIGTGGVDANARVVVTFDQAISKNQDITKFASFSGGSAAITRTDNQVIFQLNSLPSCGAFSIRINKGLIGKYDVESKTDWVYASRVTCRRAASVIGYSVKGRPIFAYYYGSGPTTILFTGGIHGSERSGSYIMRDWVNHLDSYAYKIPAGKQIVVVPDVNPDGLATNSRYNANNVNLDRNFPSANWKSDIDTASGLLAGGGGSGPMSEPETIALANLTSSLRPRLEVSFHAQGSLIGANQAGDSVNIGNIYGSIVGYRSMIGQAEQTMGYSITGEYEDWMGEQYGTPAILIELPSVSGRYFNAHQSVLWKMVSI